MSERALRFNNGKPQLSYVLTFPKANRMLAGVLDAATSRAVNPYPRGNYIKGGPMSQYIDALIRHLTSFVNGEDTDPDTGQDHRGHVVFNAKQLCECLIGSDMDDRFPVADRPVPVYSLDVEPDEDPKFDDVPHADLAYMVFSSEWGFAFTDHNGTQSAFFKDFKTALEECKAMEVEYARNLGSE